jgi:hypothetical protein
MSVIKLGDKRPVPFKQRLKESSFVGDPNFLPPITEQQSVKPQYGVDVNPDTGGIVIMLGLIPPFEVPKDTAIQLALLLLKRAGVDVGLDDGKK